MRIDLHGLTESEAIGRIETKLMDFDRSHFDELEIITGNGQVLKGLVIDTLSRYNYRWRHNGSNTGSIIVLR